MNPRDPSPPARPRRRLPELASLLVAWAAAPALAQEAPPTLVTTVCFACHGVDGNSTIPLFPKIAGQQPVYMVKQLRDFQSGKRKSDVMAPLVAQLTPDDLDLLAEYYAKQKTAPGTPPADKKVAGLGKLIYLDGNEESGVPACVGCHKAEGTGHLLFPRVGGQHAMYTAQQMKNFASGERINDVSRFMRTTTKRLTADELQAVAEYMAGLAP